MEISDGTQLARICQALELPVPGYDAAGSDQFINLNHKEMCITGTWSNFQDPTYNLTVGVYSTMPETRQTSTKCTKVMIITIQGRGMRKSKCSRSTGLR